MIMWELTTGCKPFANVAHDLELIFEILDGKRPEITEDTPECFAILMKRCWDPDPKKRPSITEICKTFNDWLFTRDPELGDYMLVMEYEKGGDLHNYLQKEFTEIKWNKNKTKRRGILNILLQIADGYLYFKYIFIYCYPNLL